MARFGEVVAVEDTEVIVIMLTRDGREHAVPVPECAVPYFLPLVNTLRFLFPLQSQETIPQKMSRKKTGYNMFISDFLLGCRDSTMTRKERMQGAVSAWQDASPSDKAKYNRSALDRNQNICMPEKKGHHVTWQT